MSAFGLDGRAVLITGASGGIGRATAHAVSDAGGRVVAVGRRTAALAETVDELSGSGHFAIVADIVDHAANADLLADAVAAVGPLHGLVHCAGEHLLSPLRTHRADRTNALFDVNVTSALSLMKAFRTPKVRGESASVVLLSSAVGIVGQAGVSAYAATKAAVSSLAQSLGLELARESIRVNAIAAGIVETPMTTGLHASLGDHAWSEIQRAHPLGLGVPEDVANAAVFLLAPASRWVTGTTLVVDGGYTAS